MNILFIGNSFSVDVSTYVHQVAKAAGLDINVYVLYVGGCPIERHYKNFLSKEAEYEFYINGNRYLEKMCDLFYGLTYTKYDVISFQQVSSLSGDANTYFPELPKLMEGVRQYSDAKFILHKTWSYGKDFYHEKYGSNPLDQDLMDKDIHDAYEKVSKIVNVPYIIPSGPAVTKARQIFGDDLNRDGFHLNERGRTLTGIVLAYFLTGVKDMDLSSFKPSGYSFSDSVGPIDLKEIPILNKIAKETIEENKGHNLHE